MSIRIVISGSILDDPCRVLVCPVNCVPGVMGKGLAYDFAVRWPGLREEHREACDRSAREYSLRPGKVAETLMIEPGPAGAIRRMTTVLLAATKDHYRDPSRLEWVRACLASLVRWAEAPQEPPRVVALPALGCGLGGLSWRGIGGVEDATREILLDPETVRRIPDTEWRVYAPKDGR